MTTFDQQLSEQLRQFARTINAQRQSLFDAHDGSCACDGRELCAFHSHTFNSLVQLEGSLNNEALHLLKGE